MPDFLPMRDAFADHAHVSSDELFAGTDRTPARFTIAIPTHRRPVMLAEAVRSALAQDWAEPTEVVVVDDDPTSQGHEQLLRDVPAIASANFRYLRNSENLRDFGNHNRCVASARSEWVTILHDDDLLDAGFAREMFKRLDADRTIDGLICRMRQADLRDVPHTEPRLRGLVRKSAQTLSFGIGETRVINARKLFWGCIVGNVVGFVFRVRDARSIGGFYPEEYPSADYFFYARFAEKFTMRELNKFLVTYRVAVNVSMNKSVNMTALRRSYELQTAYAGTVLPKRWSKLSPLLMARQVKLTGAFWGNNITPEEVGRDLGLSIPRDRPVMLYAARALLRGL